jgi:hypothetical protein
MRFFGAIVLIAFYASFATAAPFSAAVHCMFHPCHGATEAVYVANVGPNVHVHDHAASSSDSAKGHQGNAGDVKRHADCHFSCSSVLSNDVAAAVAHRMEVSVAFIALASHPDDHLAERLIRPPKLPLA